jgi:hypothetical protein
MAKLAIEPDQRAHADGHGKPDEYILNTQVLTPEFYRRLHAEPSRLPPIADL